MIDTPEKWPTFTNGANVAILGPGICSAKKIIALCGRKGLRLTHCLWKTPARPQNFQLKIPEDGFESVKLCALRVLRKMCPLNDGDIQVGRISGISSIENSGDLKKCRFLPPIISLQSYQM